MQFNDLNAATDVDAAAKLARYQCLSKLEEMAVLAAKPTVIAGGAFSI